MHCGGRLLMPLFPRFTKSAYRGMRGVSLIEILVGILIVTVASIAALSYFSYGMGGIGRQGNRRAALERARERLEQLMAANVTDLEPSDQQPWWITCNGSPCVWALVPVQATEPVPVDDLPAQQMETTVQWQDDPAAQTDESTRDVLELGVKVWFTSNVGSDDDFNRVHVRALRSP